MKLRLSVEHWFVVGLLGFTLVLSLGAAWAPHDPIQPQTAPYLSPGSPQYLLGTDAIGRDIFSRTLWGLRTSWASALVVVVSGLLFGGLVGALAGFFGGWFDDLLMRLTDLFLSLPSTLVAIAIVATLGRGLTNTLLGIAVVWWPYYARIIRGEVRSIASGPHLEAARLAGTGRLRLLTRHVLPGVFPTAVVTASLDIANVIVVLAGLSFLGLGQEAPSPELGADTAAGLQQLLSHWWIPVVPGVAVLVLSLLANVAGDALSRAQGLQARGGRP